jgi:hypothetical protein
MAVQFQQSTGVVMEAVRTGDSCRRCGGFTVPEIFPEMDAGRGATMALRCVQCGDVIDHVILTNRLRNCRGSVSIVQCGVEQSHM